MRKLTLSLIALSAAAPSVAAPVSVTVPVEVRASVVKPLTFTVTGTMNFGTIVLNNLTANRTVSISTNNVLDCGGGTPQLICSGATSVPTYNVQGTNKMSVSIIKTASSLTNASTGATLAMTLTGPTTILLTNSGAPGFDFAIGGSITLTPATGDGLYSGTVNVQVDYQ